MASSPVLGPPFPTPLTPKGISQVIQTATIAMLGIASTDATRYSQVRIGWQTSSQPAWTITDDVTIVSAIEVDDQENRIRDFVYQEKGETQATEVTLYTRVWRVMWSIHGPNSFDNARKIRSALFTQVGHDLFSGSLLYLVTDVSAPVRAPELFAAQWWERVDLFAHFNEQVVEAPVLGTAASVDIKVYNQTAPSLAQPTLEIVAPPGD